MMAFTSDTLTLLQRLVPSRPVRWILFAIGWTVVGFFSAAHWHLFHHVPDPYETFWELLRIKLVLWYIWGVFTIGILWLARRFRIESKVWPQNALVLIVSCFVITIGYTLLYSIALLINLGREVSAPNFAFMYSYVISWHSTYYFLAFWLTIGIEHLIGYVRRYRERELHASQLESQLSQAQFQNLKSQLHPHFLFNTLNTIASMIFEDKRSEAYDTVVRLGDLLRSSLDHTRSQTVHVKDEVDFLRKYLELVRARFPDRLNINLSIPEETLAAEVPSLILQPLVENAIKHGIATHSGPGEIEVIITRRDDMLEIIVSNDGPEEGVERPAAKGSGFGLASIRTRLERLYGPDYEFVFAGRPTGGATVTTRIPFRTT